MGIGARALRSNEDITRAVEMHADTVLRVCTVYFRNRPEREDAFQETFLKYAQASKRFEDEEHRKAWLIRVATNVCKDMLKRADAKAIPLESMESTPLAAVADSDPAQGQLTDLLQALGQLEPAYRMVLYLKYYEDRTAAEIASLLDMPENTVYTNLARGRKKLKEVLTCER